jgi:predicted nucleic acid-binding protein
VRVLFDNDVVLDFLLGREPFFASAKELFVRAARHEITAFVAAITPINSFYIIRKERNIDVARDSVKKLLQIVKICGVKKTTLNDALQLDFTDYEDAVQCSSAVKTKLDCIITRNLSDYEKAPLAVYSPEEFIRRLDSQESISLNP